MIALAGIEWLGAVERAVMSAVQSGITPEMLIDRLRRWCMAKDSSGRRHKLLLQLDELGQWIASGNANERIMQVQALVETAAQAGEGRIWIAVTAHGDVPMSVRAMKAGAVEFLTKPFRDQDLLDAIQLALESDRARLQREAQLAVLRHRFDSLTPREREVLPLVVSGRLNKEIAKKLGTSEITIKMHRASAMRKMQAESLVDLVKMAARLGLPGTES